MAEMSLCLNETEIDPLGESLNWGKAVFAKKRCRGGRNDHVLSARSVLSPVLSTAHHFDFLFIFPKILIGISIILYSLICE